MFIIDLINMKVFILSFTIGLFLTYVTVPKKTIINVYPTTDNQDKILYKDRSDTCFSFTSREVPCNSEDIFKIPIQQ